MGGGEFAHRSAFFVIPIILGILMQNQTTLKRSLSLPLVVLYGLGTTIGAGIYALLGEVARNDGMLSPWAFLLASLIASITALSFAEMVSRFPRSAGEALYVRKGLGLS